MSVTIKMAAGDMVKASSGRMVSVSGLEKGSQDIAETFLNNYDPADPPAHPTGSEFFTLVGSVASGGDIGVSTTIQQMADSALQRLMDAQQDDPTVDDEELIAEIVSINVWRFGDMSWAFYSMCLTDSEEEVETGFDIDLSHQLPAGIETVGLAVPGVGTPL